MRQRQGDLLRIDRFAFMANKAVYHTMLEGKVDPAEGHVLSL